MHEWSIFISIQSFLVDLDFLIKQYVPVNDFYWILLQGRIGRLVNISLMCFNRMQNSYLATDTESQLCTYLLIIPSLLYFLNYYNGPLNNFMGNFEYYIRHFIAEHYHIMREMFHGNNAIHQMAMLKQRCRFSVPPLIR